MGWPMAAMFPCQCPTVLGSFECHANDASTWNVVALGWLAVRIFAIGGAGWFWLKCGVHPATPSHCMPALMGPLGLGVHWVWPPGRGPHHPTMGSVGCLGRHHTNNTVRSVSCTGCTPALQVATCLVCRFGTLDTPGAYRLSCSN